jgi:uncharacterized protein (TIGR00303 family)
MQSYNIFTNEPDDFLAAKADFILAASVTKTCEIPGITQAGIPGMIPLTPTLDAEYISNERVYSLGELAETPTGVPSPALITRATHNLAPFSSIEIFDLGLVKKPQNCHLHDFGITPSESIHKGANIDAREVFEKGRNAGKTYELKGSYLMLAESTPAGTTTAAAATLALGYDVADDFSSSFANVPNDIKTKTIQKALSRIHPDMSNFEKLSCVGDNMLIFCAGFLMEATKRFHVVIAGGTQMAAVLLIADKLREDVLMRITHTNLTLATTQWVAHDTNANLKHLLEQLSYTPHAIYTSFSFATSEIPVLHKYDEGEAKEGVGAGGALAYANKHAITNKELLGQIEYLLYTL